MNGRVQILKPGTNKTPADPALGPAAMLGIGRCLSASRPRGGPAIWLVPRSREWRWDSAHGCGKSSLYFLIILCYLQAPEQCAEDELLSVDQRGLCVFWASFVRQLPQ